MMDGIIGQIDGRMCVDGLMDRERDRWIDGWIGDEKT